MSDNTNVILTAEEVRTFLQDAILEHIDENPELVDDLQMRSFEEAGLLTRDEGLVLRFPGGAEFQVTIIRSR